MAEVNQATLAGLGAQIATSSPGATVELSISGALGYSSTSQYGALGTVNDPDKFYILTGSTNGQNIAIGGETLVINDELSIMGSGYYVYVTMDQDGNYVNNYSVIAYIATGDTWADATKLHIFDGAAGAFFNEAGEMYTPNSFANGNTYSFESLSEGVSLTHTNGYYASGTGIFTFNVSDPSATLAQNGETSISTGSYPRTASLASSGSVSFSPGTYDVTFTLTGQLATDVDTISITQASSGTVYYDYLGRPTPFGLNGSTLDYLVDESNLTVYTFTQLIRDVSQLKYEANYEQNGGYYAAGTTSNDLLEVSFNTDPGISDYLDIGGGTVQASVEIVDVDQGGGDQGGDPQSNVVYSQQRSGAFAVTTSDSYTTIPFYKASSFRLNNYTGKIVGVRRRHKKLIVENFDDLDVSEWTGPVETGFSVERIEGLYGGKFKDAAYKTLTSDVMLDGSEVEITFRTPNIDLPYTIKFEVWDDPARIGAGSPASLFLGNSGDLIKDTVYRVIFRIRPSVSKYDVFLERNGVREEVTMDADGDFGSFQLANSIILIEGSYSFDVDPIVYQQKVNFSHELVYSASSFSYPCDHNLSEYEVINLGSDAMNYSDNTDNISLSGFYAE